jgi:2-isopropylmalate synthase
MTYKIKIFDTTLRDGDQAPGFAFKPEHKVAFARQLLKLGVDVIEAGFPASSPKDYEAIEKICKDIGKEEIAICSLARANEDIETAAKALTYAKYPRIHTFIGTSDIHIEHKFRKNREWVIEQTIKGVRKAKSYFDDVEFSCEDFSRTDLDFAVQVVSEAIKNGATTINLPDTVGCFTPSRYSEEVKYSSFNAVKYLIDKVRSNGLDAVFSVHNHNDKGKATANTEAGVYAGARQVEVTVNGIGERSGNTSLEQIIFNFITGSEFYTNVNSKLLTETSKMCAEFVNQKLPRNQPVVGENAFAHEAGIHQDGMIKDSRTYQIVDPGVVGGVPKLVCGKKSGRAAVRKKISELNLRYKEEDFEEIFRDYKEVADSKDEMRDEDFRELLKKFAA